MKRRRGASSPCSKAATSLSALARSVAAHIKVLAEL
jgi:hypothetical protein